LACLALWCSVATAALGQNGQPVFVATHVHPDIAVQRAASARADLRVDVPLILIPVHVITPLGTTVTDLSRENFRIFEDGVEQSVSHFALEDAPASIGLVFDSSGSMRSKVHRCSEAVTAFLKIANPEDEFFLVTFDDRAKLTVDFTRNSDEIYQRIARLKPLGRTSLLDAIHLAIGKMKQAHHLRRALVIFSDGGDNWSRHSEQEIKKALRESDLQVYAMGIFNLANPGKHPWEEVHGPLLLTELAEESGGNSYPVANLNDLPEVCSRIGRELRNQYLLAYRSTNSARDGRYRHIKVVVDAPNHSFQLRPYYRLGYYAPQQ
jgi:Ca-activated chloride channel family protein